MNNFIFYYIIVSYRWISHENIQNKINNNIIINEAKPRDSTFSKDQLLLINNYVKNNLSISFIFVTKNFTYFIGGMVLFKEIFLWILFKYIILTSKNSFYKEIVDMIILMIIVIIYGYFQLFYKLNFNNWVKNYTLYIIFVLELINLIRIFFLDKYFNKYFTTGPLSNQKTLDEINISIKDKNFLKGLKDTITNPRIKFIINILHIRYVLFIQLEIIYISYGILLFIYGFDPSMDYIVSLKLSTKERHKLMEIITVLNNKDLVYENFYFGKSNYPYCFDGHKILEYKIIKKNPIILFNSIFKIKPLLS